MIKHDGKQLVLVRLTLEELIAVGSALSRVEGHPQQHLIHDALHTMHLMACETIAPVPEEPTFMDRLKNLL
jgi:hypothetical protein